MGVFIELTTDPFIERFSAVAGSNATTKGAGLTRVRRPLRGLEIKEDTYAYLQLIRADGEKILLLDSSSATGYSHEYSNFILQSVQDQRMERQQVIETFGETYLYLFGEAPRFLQVTAVLINSHDFNWKDEFLENYQRYLRGTKALEYGARTYLFYDQNIVEGYMLNTSVSISSDMPLIAQMNFQFFVTNAQTVAILGDPNFPIRSSVPLPEGITLVESWGGEHLQLALNQSMEGVDYWVSQPGFQGWSRERPIREKTYAVDESTGIAISDEYTGPMQPTVDDIYERQRLQYIKDYAEWEQKISDYIKAYGLDGNTIEEPSFWEKLGLAPHFTDSGVSFGSFSGDSALGGFVGNDAMNTITLSEIGDTLQGLPGPFGDAGTAIVDKANEAAGAAESAADWGASKVNGAASSAENSASSAYASAREWAEGAAADAQREAAKAGGYTGAGEYLSYAAKQVDTTSNTTSNSSGASQEVKGDPVAFSFLSAKGTLQNENLSPNAAVSKEVG